MNAMSPVPADHPLMKAWKAHQNTEEFKSTFRQATEAIVISTQATAPEANRRSGRGWHGRGLAISRHDPRVVLTWGMTDMKRIAAALIILPLAGVAFGAGISTLYWSGQMERQFRAQAEWKRIVGQWERASNSFEKTANECLSMIQVRR